MGLLDDAIREHLELKRRRGADPAEVARQEQEALGPAVRERDEAAPAAEPAGRSRAPAPEAAAAPEAHEPPPHAAIPSAARPVDPEPERRPAAGAPRRPLPPAEPEPAPPHARARVRRRPRRRPPSSTSRTCPPRRTPRRRRGEAARGDEDVLEETPGVPPGDAGARPALVRAEAAARLRLRRLSGGRPPPHLARRLHATARCAATSSPSSTTPTSSTTPRCSPSRARRGCRRRRSCRRRTRRRRLPQPDLTMPARAAVRRPSVARHRGGGGARGAARRRRRYVQQTPAGLQPIDVEARRAHRAQPRCSRSRASLGPELDPAEVLRRVGLDAADADPELPAQVVSTGVPQVLAPVARRRRSRAPCPDFARASSALLDEHERDRALPRRRRPGRRPGARPRVLADPADMGEDPATGSAAGPLMRLPARTGAASSAWTSTRASRWAVRASSSAAVEGDRVRVGGDAAIVIEGTVLL